MRYILFNFGLVLIVSATRRSVGPLSEKFDKVSNDHGRTQKCNFCVSIWKINLRDLIQT